MKYLGGEHRIVVDQSGVDLSDIPEMQGATLDWIQDSIMAVRLALCTRTSQFLKAAGEKGQKLLQEYKKDQE